MAVRTAALCALALALAGQATARPVSYEGGWTLIEETDRQGTSLWVHYTLNPELSLGLRSEWDRQNDVVLNTVQATWLVNRWFGENYQANVYAFGGAGLANGVGNNPADPGPAAYAGVFADWETRRWFTSYQARYSDGTTVNDQFMQAGRMGFAPYVANTGAIHTWLMVEVDHRPDNPEELGITPLVRLFKGGALLELGWSVTDDQPLVNFTYRF